MGLALLAWPRSASLATMRRQWGPSFERRRRGYSPCFFTYSSTAASRTSRVVIRLRLATIAARSRKDAVIRTIAVSFSGVAVALFFGTHKTLPQVLRMLQVQS
jgi:hypothetical protein